ncbi:antitoxin YezG family protein [Priestia megaterium]|uniref:antitoxin YezG family protein n=1 Tax=Priestia megaterium TaxID=1404 RepID=UPI00352B49F7
MKQLHKEIAETVNKMIPEEWGKFYFYAQISENGGGTYFFYNTLENKHYKYSLEIPFKYEINEDEFERQEDVLYQLSKELRNIFKSNHQELWYSFTMSVDSNRKLNIHYDYTNWFDTKYSFSDQMMIWKRKYLGEEASEEKGRALIAKYDSEFPNDPI